MASRLMTSIWRRVAWPRGCARSWIACRQSTTMNDAEGTTGDCPQRVELEILATGATASESLSAHLKSCPSCQELLRQIVADNDLLGSALFAESESNDIERILDQPIEGYTVLKEIHRGGQGVVFLARQLSTNRTVAIKMLLQGRFATSSQRMRFDREVELVAGLRHPGIVTLYESGSTIGGDVYFAMEYVDGRTLDCWHAQQTPTSEEVASLFVEICGAVRYAHGRGIIHRDLKPGNILVGADHHPHILDFGIARVADSASTDETMATEAGQFLGTFSYAAPEQLEGAPERVDVRVDVFALGVLLYEMLCGRKPFEMGDSLAELIGNRLDRIPPAPSSHVSGISHDLDVICLKALSPDPERRYASAGEMEEDLRRHLDGRPILARADSTSYVLGRLIRRHKIPVLALASIVVLVITSLISLGFLYAEAEHERRVADETLRGFQDSIGIINPQTGQGTHDMSVGEYVRIMEDHVVNELNNQPRVGSALLTTLGLIELAFDEVEKSQSLLEKALELRRDSGPAGLGEAYHNLGRVLFRRGEYDRALVNYQNALRERLAAHGRIHPDVAMTYQHLGSTQRRVGDYSAALAEFVEAEMIWEALYGPDSEQIAGLLNNRAWVLVDQARVFADSGRTDEARELLEDAHFRLLDASAMIRGIVPPNDYRIGRSERSVGQVLMELGRTEEAIPHFDESLRIQISRQGDRSDGVLRTKLLRASAYIEQGTDLEEASREVRAVAEIREKQALEYQTKSAWRQALIALQMLERIHLIRDDADSLEQVRDDLARIEKALQALSG
ncbi:MAG: hypothetical protein CMJ33_11190 [Phycisphaerae bacterium]|nr:hypothetical protein [Phycisphaerae bacterium]HAW96633.1 hypothetical protein [Phycisphaerales bacterium]